MTSDDKDKYSRDTGCCVNPERMTIDCLETICAKEFPGGIKAFLRYKAMRALLEQGYDINSAARELKISVSEAQKRFNRAAGR